MKTLSSRLYDAILTNKRVIVRTDFNVPLKQDGTILDDFRLKETLSTLRIIKEKGGVSIILTHCGQPTEKKESLSTKKFVPWLEQNGFTVRFASTPEEAKKKDFEKKHDIVLVENLRFFSGEKKEDPAFAQELATLGTYFVQDAFGALHRRDASISLLPTLFNPEKRSIGLLVEKELNKLNLLVSAPNLPLVLVLGGNKIETKLPLISYFLDKASSILLCPALVFTFLKARGVSVGNSFVEKTMVRKASEILEKAEHSSTKLIFPCDYLVTDNTFEQPYPLRTVQSLSGTTVGISIGPSTVRLFKKELLKARTIFFNGLMGNPHFTETLEATKSLLHVLQETSATKIIAGGDSVGVAKFLNFEKDMAFFSTGGGATLEYLSGRTLAGLIPFY